MVKVAIWKKFTFWVNICVSCRKRYTPEFMIENPLPFTNKNVNFSKIEFFFMKNQFLVNSNVWVKAAVFLSISTVVRWLNIFMLWEKENVRFKDRCRQCIMYVVSVNGNMGKQNCDTPRTFLQTHKGISKAHAISYDIHFKV